MCRKVFVDVNANFKADGTIIPLSIKWEDGYTCRIEKNITNIFLEENAWFIETKKIALNSCINRLT